MICRDRQAYSQACLSLKNKMRPEKRLRLVLAAAFHTQGAFLCLKNSHRIMVNPIARIMIEIYAALHHLSLRKAVFDSGYSRVRWYRQKKPAINQMTENKTMLLDKKFRLLSENKPKFLLNIGSIRYSTFQKEKFCKF